MDGINFMVDATSDPTTPSLEYFISDTNNINIILYIIQINGLLLLIPYPQSNRVLLSML